VLLFAGGVRCLINTQKVTKRNQWAKVRVAEDAEGAEGQESRAMKTGELIEVSPSDVVVRWT